MKISDSQWSITNADQNVLTNKLTGLLQKGHLPKSSIFIRRDLR